MKKVWRVRFLVCGSASLGFEDNIVENGSLGGLWISLRHWCPDLDLPHANRIRHIVMNIVDSHVYEMLLDDGTRLEVSFLEVN